MAKLIYIISTLMLFQLCIEAAPNTGYSDNGESLSKLEEVPDKLEEADPKLNNEPQEVGKDTNEESSQGQRQKRFYNYFSFGFSPYDTFSTQFVKRDQSQDTGVYGAEDLYSQIYKRVQDILYITRQQAFSPSFPRFPVPQQIPIFYVPYPCGCTPGDNARPSYDEEPSNDVTPAPDTTTTTHSTINTSQQPSTATSSTDETNNTTPDLFSRFNESDEEDGARPISFEPIKPDKPLSRPPPPVDHGSSQASQNNLKDFEAAPSMIQPPSVSGIMAQPDLPTNAIPTLCDGAILTCCHKPEPVTESCFNAQGCPDTSPYDNPCDANVILTVIRKFQYYYANRRG